MQGSQGHLCPIESPLPESAASLLRRVRPVLEQFLDLGRFLIDGGSALATRSQHRQIFNVDLFSERFASTMPAFEARQPGERPSDGLG